MCESYWSERTSNDGAKKSFVRSFVSLLFISSRGEVFRSVSSDSLSKRTYSVSGRRTALTYDMLRMVRNDPVWDGRGIEKACRRMHGPELRNEEECWPRLGGRCRCSIEINLSHAE